MLSPDGAAELPEPRNCLADMAFLLQRRFDAAEAQGLILSTIDAAVQSALRRSNRLAAKRGRQ